MPRLARVGDPWFRLSDQGDDERVMASGVRGWAQFSRPAARLPEVAPAVRRLGGWGSFRCPSAEVVGVRSDACRLGGRGSFLLPVG